MTRRGMVTLVALTCLAFTLGIVDNSMAACYKGTEKECKAAIKSPKNSCSNMEDILEDMQQAAMNGDKVKAKTYAQEILDEYKEFQNKLAAANTKMDKAEKSADDAKAKRVVKRYRKRMDEYVASADKSKNEAEKILAQ